MRNTKPKRAYHRGTAASCLHLRKMVVSELYDENSRAQAYLLGHCVRVDDHLETLGDIESAATPQFVLVLTIKSLNTRRPSLFKWLHTYSLFRVACHGGGVTAPREEPRHSGCQCHRSNRRISDDERSIAMNARADTPGSGEVG